MSRTLKPIGILGGTFDPIHYGHLRTALELYQHLDLQEIRFIPCDKPVFTNKTTYATNDQRLTMLQLAIADQKNFVIDERELKRNLPSYTVDTLISLSKELKNTPLCLIIGCDAFINLPQWHRWQELIKFAHLIVVTRPGYILPQEGLVAEFLLKHQISDPQLLQKQRNGYIFSPRFITPLAISATAIREQIIKGLSPRYLLPDAVLDYIQRMRIYTHYTSRCEL